MIQDFFNDQWVVDKESVGFRRFVKAINNEFKRLRTENDQLKGQIRLKDMQVAELNKSILPHMPSEKIARALCCACGEDPDAVGDVKGNDYRWQDFLECVLLFREALK